MSDYAHPEVLVETSWVAEHATDADVRLVELAYDPAENFKISHNKGSVLLDWRKDINDPLTRDLADRATLQATLRRLGLSENTTVVLYGDFNNWSAAFAFWTLVYYRVPKVRLMNGGRKKWILEDRPLDRALPQPPLGELSLSAPNEAVRAYYDDVLELLPKVSAGRVGLVDVRSPKEFSGELLAPPEYPTEHAQRGGHIPGARNVPWGLAVNDDGTFKSRADLEALYSGVGLAPKSPVVTYCRIGERSSHTWFVLTYLLGYPKVRNYDGSWTEWGNRIRSPVERP